MPGTQINVESLVKVIIGLFILFIILLIAFVYLEKLNRKRQYLDSSLADLDKLTGEAFEKYLAVIFEEMGYSVKLTPKSHDYGADLILKKNGEVTVVQAKRYNSNVGVAAVQQIVGAKAYYNADKCLIATNRYFTASAKNLAKANHVKLMDRNAFWKITKK